MAKKNKKFSFGLLTLALVAVGYVLVGYLLYSGSLSRQVSNMLIPISVYIILAVSLNLVVGLLGELSLGHAGFMSVGLFSGCLLSIALSSLLPAPIRLPLCMIFGGLFAALFGFMVGLPALRLKGDYLAIVTLACGEIIKNIITNLSFTGGALGLNTNAIYSNAKTLLPYAGILVLLTVIVMMNLKKSKHGRAIMAIRDNRIAAESVGISATKYKLMAFVTSAVLAGAAGALYAMNYSSVAAKKFDFNASILVLVFVVLGGLGNIRGSVIAAAFLTVLPEFLRNLGLDKYRMLVYAIVLILVMIATNNENSKEFFAGLRRKLVRSAPEKGANGHG